MNYRNDCQGRVIWTLGISDEFSIVLSFVKSYDAPSVIVGTGFAALNSTNAFDV